MFHNLVNIMELQFVEMACKEISIYCVAPVELLASMPGWFWLSFSLFSSLEGTFDTDGRWLRSNTDSCSRTGTGATAGSTGIGGVWCCKWLGPMLPKLPPNDVPVPLTKCRPKIRIYIFMASKS